MGLISAAEFTTKFGTVLPEVYLTLKGSFQARKVCTKHVEYWLLVGSGTVWESQKSRLCELEGVEALDQFAVKLEVRTFADTLDDPLGKLYAEVAKAYPNCIDSA